MPTRLSIRVIPNASKDEVVGWRDAVLCVRVRVPAQGGRANEAVCKTLARHLQCRAREVRLVSGATSRRKVVELPDRLADHVLGE